MRVRKVMSSPVVCVPPDMPLKDVADLLVRHGRWLWVHNGLIRGFPQLKRDLVLAVDPSLYPAIEYGLVHHGHDELHPFRPRLP